MKRFGKRGVTLAELCVVLAVISIVSTMVVSFTVMVNQRSRISRARLEALQDIELIETIVESNIENVTDTNVEVKDNWLMIDGEQEVKVETVTGITVKIIGEDDRLYICTVTYKIPYESHDRTYTFCVNPYVGESIGG